MPDELAKLAGAAGSSRRAATKRSRCAALAGCAGSFGAGQVAHHAADADAAPATAHRPPDPAVRRHPGQAAPSRCRPARSRRARGPGAARRRRQASICGRLLSTGRTPRATNSASLPGVGPCSTETVAAAGSKGFSTIASSRWATKNCLQPAAASAGATCAAPSPYASALTTAAQSALPTRACSCRQLATMAARSIVSTAPAV